MKDLYLCDECLKLMKPEDKIYHVIGSRGEAYFCPKCMKEHREKLEAKRIGIE